MRDIEIDEILKHAARGSGSMDPALVDRVVTSISSSLRPVRPMSSRRVLAAALILICVAVAFAGAARLGFYGVRALNVFERALIFPALGILLWVAARTCVSAVIPGSPCCLTPRSLLAAAGVTLVAIFAVLFQDYGTDRFLSRGLACLNAGLMDAIPAAIAGWFVLRRGFAVDAIAAGIVAGTLAGLAGITMLELHCPNLTAPHVMLWHTGVVVSGSAIGALLAQVSRLLAAR